MAFEHLLSNPEDHTGTIYKPNKNLWGKGHVVIHDADAKEPKMLMMVIGRTRDGLIKTQYVDKRQKRTIYKNDLKYLHEPELFGLNSRWGVKAQEYFEDVQREFEMVRWWNQIYPEVVFVKTMSADGDGLTTYTTGHAKFQSGGYGTVYLKGHGYWALRFVVVVPEPDAEDD